ncbi:PepSY domain-containing protein [Paenibacillus sp. CAU 1782]
MISKKKGWIIGLGLVVALGGTSAVVAAETAGSYIGKTKAKEIALKEVPGTVTDIELERKRDVVYYEVDIDRRDSYQEADVHVDAYTGKVLRVVNDDDDAPRNASVTAPAASAVATAAPSAVSASVTASPATQTPSATAAPAASPSAGPGNAKPSAVQPSPTTAPSTAPSGTSSAAAKTITKEQAAKLAQEAIKGGDVIRVSTDRDDGMLQYEVKLKLARGYAEVEIAAATGKVLDIDYDGFDDDDDYDDDDFDDDDYYDDDDYDDRYDDDRYRG